MGHLGDAVSAMGHLGDRKCVSGGSGKKSSPKCPRPVEGDVSIRVCEEVPSKRG